MAAKMAVMMVDSRVAEQDAKKVWKRAVLMVAKKAVC